MPETPIPPALSLDEWAKLRVERETFVAEPLRDLFVGKPRGNIGVLLKNGVWMSETPRDSHALAALCLHGQPFGFTHYDVTLLRHAAEHAKPSHPELLGLASRIAALLRPTADDGTPPSTP